MPGVCKESLMSSTVAPQGHLPIQQAQTYPHFPHAAPHKESIECTPMTEAVSWPTTFQAASLVEKDHVEIEMAASFPVRLFCRSFCTRGATVRVKGLAAHESVYWGRVLE